MGKKVIYLAGPITGVEKYWEAFEEADDILSSKGYAVLNPSRLPQGMDALNYACICSVMISTADAVLFLPGWENSMGASFEYVLAGQMKKATYIDINKLCEEVSPV